MSKFSSHENRVLTEIRNDYRWEGQRTLATLIVHGYIPSFLRRKVNESGLNLRSFGSVYSAIRRLDDRLIDERNAGRATTVLM